MFGMAILEVAIGIILVYGLLSLITSAIVEMITRRLAMRSENLLEAIKGMLDTDGDGEVASAEILEHPLINSLSKPGRAPSYIPRHQFARALLASVPALAGKPREPQPTDADALRKSIAEIKNAKVRIALESLTSDATATLADVQANIEQWFDDTMARASGWFQRRIGKFLIWTGLILVVTVNADTIQIVRTLYLTPSLRQSVVALAEEKIAKEEGTPAISKSSKPAEPQQIVEENIVALGPLIGWSDHDMRRLIPSWVGTDPIETDPIAVGLAWIQKLLGLTVSVIAVSLGAPFWFDLLGKLVSLRTSIREPLTVENKATGTRGQV